MLPKINLSRFYWVMNLITSDATLYSDLTIPNCHENLILWKDLKSSFIKRGRTFCHFSELSIPSCKCSAILAGSGVANLDIGAHFES